METERIRVEAEREREYGAKDMHGNRTFVVACVFEKCYDFSVVKGRDSQFVICVGFSKT